MAYKRKIKWNSERILSLSAMSISFITLIIFIYQTNLMSRQNDLSILPYLQVATSAHSESGSYSLSLKNHGVGPAIIESVIMEFKGNRYDLKDYKNELFDFLTLMAPELDSIHPVNTSTLDKGIAIPANSVYLIIDISDSPEDYRIITENLYQLESQGLKYEITYKSIQNERWMINTDSEGPVKLD